MTPPSGFLYHQYLRCLTEVGKKDFRDLNMGSRAPELSKRL
jgi:hypothetical protein